MKYIIGVYGLIGSGKSTFISLLKTKINATFLSADEENRLLLNDSNYLSLLSAHFPECFNGDILDKEALKKIIFNDKNKNDLLRSLSHNTIKSNLLKKIESAKTDIIIVEISVYVENFIDFDQNWLVVTPYNKQVKRLSNRDKINAETAITRINFQYLPPENKFDLVIKNDGSLKKLSSTVDKIANYIINNLK